MSSLYRRLIGPAFDRLPPSLRYFHDVTTEWRGRSTFRVIRGEGRLRNLVARLGGLPPAGEAVPMRLRVVAEGERERWIRRFGEHTLESVQSAWNGLLVESFGSLTLGFQLAIEPPRLQLLQVRAWWFGMPLPQLLAPSGTAIEVGLDGGCAIVATAYAPLVGMIVRYEGFVERE